jgi:hypothetical protein
MKIHSALTFNTRAVSFCPGSSQLVFWALFSNSSAKLSPSFSSFSVTSSSSSGIMGYVSNLVRFTMSRFAYNIAASVSSGLNFPQNLRHTKKGT